MQEDRLRPELSGERSAPNTCLLGCKYPSRAGVNSN